MIRAIEGFDRYATPAELLKRKNGIVFTFPNGASNLAISTLTASGVGHALAIGAPADTLGAGPIAIQGKFDKQQGTQTVAFGLLLEPTNVAGASNTLVLDLFDLDNGVRQASVHIQREAGLIALFDALGNQVVAETLPVFSKTAFSFVETTLGVGAAGAGACSIQVNGLPVISATSIDTQGGTLATWNGFVLSIPSSDGTLQSGGLIDDMRLSDSLPGRGVFATDGAIGPAYAIPAFPIANGSTDQWTPSSGANFQCVDSLSGSGTTSLSVTSSTESAFVDLYQVGKVASSIVSCLAVELSGEYATSSPYIEQVNLGMLSAGEFLTYEGGVSLEVTEEAYAFGIYSSTSELDPVTQANWTVANFNTRQFGHQIPANMDIGSTGDGLGELGGGFNAGIGASSPFGVLNFTPSNGITFSAIGYSELAGYPFPYHGVGGVIQYTIYSTPLNSDGSAVPGGNPVCLLTISLAIRGVLDKYGDLTAYELVGTIYPSGLVYPGEYISGPTSWQCDIGGIDPGTRFQYSFSGLAYTTHENADQAFGTVQIYTPGADNGVPVTTYKNVVIADSPEGQIQSGIVGQDIGLSNNTMIIKQYFPPPPQTFFCNQFLATALVSAAAYGSSPAGGSGMPAIYPTLPGAKYPLRRAIWSNGVATGASGAEVRTAYWTQPLWEWEISYDYLPNEQGNGLTPSDWKELLGFFLGMGGQFQGFYYNDVDDNVVTGQAIATGDGATSAFQLVRTFGGTITGTESIGGLNENIPMNVYLAGELQEPNTYTVVTAVPKDQQLVFNNPPPAGAAITVDMGYYFYVRFAEDQMETQKFFYKIWSNQKVKIRSLRQA